MNLLPKTLSPRFILSCMFVVFLMLPTKIKAQTHKLDSLSRLITNSKSDTQRINLMVKKATEFSAVNIDSAISISKRAIGLAQKINYIQGEADALIKLSNNLLYKGEYSIAKTNVDVAKKDYEKLKDTLGLARVYSTLGMYYGMQSRYDTSIIYFKKVVALAEEKHYNTMLGNAYQNIATSYQMQSNYNEALAYYQKALSTAESANDVNRQAYINMNLVLRAESKEVEGTTFIIQLSIL